jgi:long-subunit fatty acid transport protein
MRTLILITVLMVLFGLGIRADGQALNNFNFEGDGARARGMGGAYISISDDASALTWNPAGLIQIIDPQLSFSFDLFMPNTDYSLDYPNATSQNTSVIYDDTKFRLQYAAFAAPIRIRDHPFVGAVSFSTISSEYDYFEANPDSGFTDPSEPVNLIERTDNRLNQLRLGFGTNVWKKLNFGLGANIYFGKGYVDTSFFYHTSYMHPTQNVLVNVDAKGFVYDTISFSGFNLAGGLLWDDERFAIGATVKTPFWLTQEHVKHELDSVYVNNVLNGELVRGDIDEQDKERVEVPWMVGVGASYQVNERFLVASDFEWRRLGVMDYRVHYDTILSNGDVEENFVESNLNLYNGYTIRVGGEYKFDGGFATIPVRAGFAYDAFGFRMIENLEFEWVDWADDQPDSLTQTFDYGDQITGYTISLGAGLHWELIKLDFAFEYDTRDTDIEGVDHFGTFQVAKEYRTPRISLNFTGFFK